ncbi:MAG: aminoacetone oxidase family FAD-binding enzyme, partial [Wujia sp.]
MYEVCVIGGGVSGMAAAITAAKKGKKVAIIDRNTKLGRKLYATGNGRCNITNETISFPDNYYSSDDNYLEFLHIAMGDRPKDMVLDFLNQIEIKTKSVNGYIYPASMQASSFVWAMIDEINKLGIDIILKSEVSNIQSLEDGFKIFINDRAIECKALILACGGKSYKALGGTDKGYELCVNLGHGIVDLRPSLCGMKVKENISDIAGVRASAKATLYVNESPLLSQKGELQFTEYGLSGIMIFNLASRCGLALSNKNHCTIKIDLAEDIKPNCLINFIHNSSRSILGCLNTYLNDKLCTHILNGLDINPKQKTGEL